MTAQSPTKPIIFGANRNGQNQTKTFPQGTLPAIARGSELAWRKHSKPNTKALATNSARNWRNR